MGVVDQSAAVVVPSCGGSGGLQVAAQDSPQGDGGGAVQGLVHQGEGPERRRSHPGWAQ